MDFEREWLRNRQSSGTEKLYLSHRPILIWVGHASIGGIDSRTADSTPTCQQLISHLICMLISFFARARPQGSQNSPRYRFTPAQKRAWRRFCAVIERIMEDNESGEEVESTSSAVEIPDVEKTDRPVHEEAGLNQVDKSCLDFCIVLLDQGITRTEYDSSLVNALAVLGVDEDRWLGPDRYLPILSRMTKLARMMVVQHAWENSDEDERADTSGSASQMRELLSDDSDHDEENESEQERFATEGTGCLGRVRDMMNRFMIRGSHSPMQWTLDLRTYGLNIHYNTTSAGHIDWIGDQIVYKNIQFSMRQFRSIIHGLITETRRLMMEDLLFVPQLRAVPSIEWTALHDNPSENTPGWSFKHDERHEFAVDGEWWLFNRKSNHEEVKRRFVQPKSEMQWNHKGIETYMAQVMEFREKLLV